jgi:hypothetical protein
VCIAAVERLLITAIAEPNSHARLTAHSAKRKLACIAYRSSREKMRPQPKQALVQNAYPFA